VVGKRRHHRDDDSKDRRIHDGIHNGAAEGCVDDEIRRSRKHLGSSGRHRSVR
jgi:hypothetical protein